MDEMAEPAIIPCVVQDDRALGRLLHMQARGSGRSSPRANAIVSETRVSERRLLVWLLGFGVGLAHVLLFGRPLALVHRRSEYTPHLINVLPPIAVG